MKYLTQNSVSMWNSALREKSNFHLPKVFASMEQFFFLEDHLALDENSMKFLDFSHFSQFADFSILKSFSNLRDNKYIPCLSLIPNAFFTCDENKLVKYQNVSKSYDNDFLQNFLLLFLSFVTAPIATKGHILAGIYIAFLQNVLYQTWKLFKT